MKRETNLFEGECGPLDPLRDTAENERRRQQEAEWNKHVTEYAAKVQELCDRLDAAFAPFLKNQMAAENEKSRVSARAKKDFEEFRAYTARWEPPLPHLPARPQAVAAFICGEMENGSAHVSRLCRSISTVHKAVDLADPCSDILIRGLLRLARETDNKETQTQEGN
jgi:hypothetical protein